MLQEITWALRALVQVEKVEEHLVDNATKGLVQWMWCHFRPDEIPQDRRGQWSKLSEKV